MPPRPVRPGQVDPLTLRPVRLLPSSTMRAMTRRHQTPAATPAVAVGYVRVSTEEQAREGVSLDAQTE